MSCGRAVGAGECISGARLRAQRSPGVRRENPTNPNAGDTERTQGNGSRTNPSAAENRTNPRQWKPNEPERGGEPNEPKAMGTERTRSGGQSNGVAGR
jgi:hypothetical protein